MPQACVEVTVPLTFGDRSDQLPAMRGSCPLNSLGDGVKSLLPALNPTDPFALMKHVV